MLMLFFHTMFYQSNSDSVGQSCKLFVVDKHTFSFFLIRDDPACVPA